MPSVAHVHAALTRLIADGAYAGDRLPAERELCEVLGASRTTLRRVVSRLEAEGVVIRSDTGRVLIRRGGHGGSLRRIAFIAPAFASTGTLRWEGALRHTAASRHPGLHIASLRFTGWGDPVLGEVKRGCDGVFLLPGAEPPPERLLQTLAGPGAAVASLEADLSAAGIPSVRLHPAGSVVAVLDAMHAHGHRRIGWLNTQPECPITTANQETCRRWMRDRGVDGPVISDPVVPFEDPAPRAREAMRRCLRDHPQVTAWLCSVVATARGAIRAVHDLGLVAGREVSLATVDGECQEDLNVPSLACAANVDPEPHLALCLAWMLDGAARAWPGPLLVQPTACAFHAGESLARVVPG